MKKPLMIVLGAIVLGGIGAATYVLVDPAKPTESATPNISVSPTTTPAALLVWDDPAGFTFSYPEGVVIDKHDEDKQNYAHVEMTHPAHPGKLIVWAKDLPVGVTTAELWVKKDASYKEAVTFDTTLGDIAAKKILLSQPQKKMIVGTVADGILIYVEADLVDEPYWQQAVDAIAQSFALKVADNPAGAVAAPAADAPVDEEEVLE